MKFGEWLPDRDVFENPGLVKALNVIPGTYYRPLRSLVAQGGAMGEECLGAYSTKLAGNAFNFAGTGTDLYKITAGDWTSVKSSLTTTGENVWRFERFGDLVIATNRDENIQHYDISADSAFSDLAGNPPKAKHIAVVRDFVVLGNTITAENQVRWSAINNAEGWTEGTDEADSQIIPEGGAVTGLMGGEYGLVFQERRIVRMDYQGPPFGFTFDEIEKNTGCIAAGSIIRFGVRTYYLSHNGFYVTDGTQSVPIGSEKIDKDFFSKADETLLYKMSATVDPLNKLVIWSYVGKDSANSRPNRLIIYNWDLKRWAEAELLHDKIFNSLSTGVDLDSLDPDHPNLDLMDTSLDSRTFQGGTLVLSAVDQSGYLSTFTGDVMEAHLKTGQMELNELRRTLLTEVWPEIDGTIQVKVGKKENHQTAASTTGFINVGASGFAPFLENSRYFDFEFKINDWSRASGFKAKAEALGEY